MRTNAIVTLLTASTLLLQASLASAFYLNLNTQANSVGDLTTALSLQNPNTAVTGTVNLDPNRFSSTGTATLTSPYGSATNSDSQVAPNVAYAQASVYDLNHQFDAIGQVNDFNPNTDLTLIGTDANVFGNATASYTQFFTVAGSGTVEYDAWYSVLKDVLDLTGAGGPIHARWDVRFLLGRVGGGVTSFTDGEDYFIDALSSGRAGGDFMTPLFLSGFANGDTGYISAYASTAVVPEPGTFLLVGAGLAGLVVYRRKRMTITRA